MRLKYILVLGAVVVALGGFFVYLRSQKPPQAAQQTDYAWTLDSEELLRVSIRLPRDGKSQTFFRATDGSWHFDDQKQTAVDKDRWGGIPVLLASGPRGKKILVRDASQEEFDRFGLAQPRMVMTISTSKGGSLRVNIGDNVPDASSFYMQVPETRDVAVVDYSWYYVFDRLVTEPPYPATATR